MINIQDFYATQNLQDFYATQEFVVMSHES